MRPVIVLSGRGKMAQEVRKVARYETLHVATFNRRLTKDDSMIAVHFGSGKKLRSLIRWCEKHQVPLIQGSTGVFTPKSSKTVFINAPNVSPDVVLRIRGIVEYARRSSFHVVAIWESHQQEKENVSGTALLIAKAVNFPVKKIRSIRDPKEQLRFGVPRNALTRHAFHWIFLKGANVTAADLIAVTGLRPYAFGAVWLARKLLKSELEAGVYEFIDIIDRR